jgi:hypothetical protein
MALAARPLRSMANHPQTAHAVVCRRNVGAAASARPSGRRQQGRHRLEHQHRLHHRPRSPARCRGPHTTAACSCFKKRLRQHAPTSGPSNNALHEALGRSRGGLTTKIHLSADGKCPPLSLLVTPGSEQTARSSKPSWTAPVSLDSTWAGRGGVRTASVQIRRTATAQSVATLRRRGIRHAIPEKTDTRSARLRRGSESCAVPFLLVSAARVPATR